MAALIDPIVHEALSTALMVIEWSVSESRDAFALAAGPLTPSVPLMVM
jgi:hypothetical protein